MILADELEKRIKDAADKGLRQLDLSNLGLSAIPPEVFGLTQLTELKIGHWADQGKQHKNAITAIPPEISRLKRLKLLDLSSNKIQALPIELGELRHLEHLDLRNNELEALPEVLGRLTNLKHLDASHNSIGQLPDFVGNWNSLNILGLSGNKLSELPDSFSQLTQLQRLDLESNDFVVLPDVASRLPLLQRLGLSNNRLELLPDDFGALKSLQRLYLSNNRLRELPGSFPGLANLQRLYISGNLLAILPHEFWRLQNLQLLDARNNKLSVLPDGFERLARLEYLDIRSNRLQVLPEALSELKQLQLLDLSENLIRTIPPSIVELPGLQYLYLRANPLESPPPEIANRGINAMRKYFGEIAKATEKDYLFECKLLLVGEGRVGKTSLSKSLSIPGYLLDDHQSTEGIDINTWIIDKGELGLPKDFRLNIWDFGGQEIYHATHQFFLTKRAIYLLVTESRKEDRHEDFYYWLNIIKLLGDKSPVIIVLNKCDQPTKDLPIKEYAKTFGNIADFKKISCTPEYRHTIQELKEAIKGIITNRRLLPHLGTPLPKVWVDIRKELEGLKQSGRNYIGWTEYLNMCRKHRQNEESALFLSEFFHDLGVLLHFQDDEDLKDMVFLNHDWVTKGVYNILDNHIIKEAQGQFNDGDLAHIWMDESGRDTRYKLLSLMKNPKFELCFELSPGNYLAPQLLPVDEVDHSWPEKGKLRFEYRYRFMPKGILTRFIVKRHKDIVDEKYWRYGALLDRNNTRALVKEDYFGRKINVAVEGADVEGMLKRVRDTIEDINKDIGSLEVAQFVSCQCEDCADASQPQMFDLQELQQYREEGERHIKCKNIRIKNVEVAALLARFEDSAAWRDSPAKKELQLHEGGVLEMEDDAPATTRPAGNASPQSAAPSPPDAEATPAAAHTSKSAAFTWLDGLSLASIIMLILLAIAQLLGWL